VAEEVVMYDKETRLLVKHNDTHILLSEQRNQNQTNQIILHTADCLANYCRLKAKGIHFKKEPSYLNEGLCIVFADPFGNEYTLLEERSYSEI
jgi:predicted enzyme related to lactoylglutathione lyase